ncbi:hypothetical protein HYD42_02280 [Mycoplasmopsis bovis]|nr:hypothetical protein HYD42_02280 [Mycoplasmopsis bovis]
MTVGGPYSWQRPLKKRSWSIKFQFNEYIERRDNVPTNILTLTNLA